MSAPILDEEDKVTAKALLVRLIRVQEERNRLGDLKKVLDEKHKSFEIQWSRCRDAFAVLGFDTNSKELWDDIRTAISKDEWNAAFDRARANPLPQTTLIATPPVPPLPPLPAPPLPPPPPPPSFLASPAPSLSQLFTGPPAPHDETAEETGSEETFDGLDEPPQSVREFTLEALKNMGPWGTKAADIRSSYEATRGVKLHDKTIGMTLYRLSKENPPLARREGRTWFFVAPSAETKNPGGGTPGQNDFLE